MHQREEDEDKEDDEEGLVALHALHPKEASLTHHSLGSIKGFARYDEV
jgi:hypothetical protein